MASVKGNKNTSKDEQVDATPLSDSLDISVCTEDVTIMSKISGSIDSSNTEDSVDSSSLFPELLQLESNNSQGQIQINSQYGSKEQIEDSKNLNGQKEINESGAIGSRIENTVEETTTMVTKGESLNTTAESFTEQVPNLFQLKYESEKKRNQVLDVLQVNLNREEIDDKNTFENSEETTTMNRRLPEFYPGIHISSHSC